MARWLDWLATAVFLIFLVVPAIATIQVIAGYQPTLEQHENGENFGHLALAADIWCLLTGAFVFRKNKKNGYSVLLGLPIIVAGVCLATWAGGYSDYYAQFWPTEKSNKPIDHSIEKARILVIVGLYMMHEPSLTLTFSTAFAVIVEFVKILILQP